MRLVHGSTVYFGLRCTALHPLVHLFYNTHSKQHTIGIGAWISNYIQMKQWIWLLIHAFFQWQFVNWSLKLGQPQKGVWLSIHVLISVKPQYAMQIIYHTPRKWITCSGNMVVLHVSSNYKNINSKHPKFTYLRQSKHVKMGWRFFGQFHIFPVFQN